MKIAIVSKEFPPSRASYGIGTYAGETASYLVRMGHDVTVICASDDAEGSDTRTELLRVIRIPDYERLAIDGKIKKLFSSFKTAAMRYRTQVADQLDALIDQGEADIVEFPGFRGESHVWAKRDRRIPMVVRMHGYTGWVLKFWKDYVVPARRLQMRLETEELQAADFVTSVSKQQAQAVLRRLPPSRVVTLYNGIDSALWARRAQQSTAIASGQDIVFVGSMTEIKGVTDLLDAADRLQRSYGWKGRLLLIGRSSRAFEGLMAGRWKHLADNHSWLQVLGHQDRELLGAIYASAAVCCFPSRLEPFGFTALEAMASGGLVVGAEGTGMAEVIEEGVTGYLAPRRNPEGLAKVLAHALSLGVEEAATIRTHAQAQIQSHFDLSVIGVQTAELYGRVIAQHAKQGAR